MHISYRPPMLMRGVSLWARIDAGRLPAVQILRALAALSVVVGHVLYEAKSFAPIGEPKHVMHAYNWTAGVDLFFILSGFIMMWTFGHRFGEPLAWLEFMRRRLLRILPPYWAFTALMVAATLLFADRLETAVFTADHALLSFLFIPHIAPHGGIHPILAVGWTLMYEMFFYASFALALLFRRTAGLAILVALFFLVHGLARYTGLLPEALRLFWGDAVLFEFLFGLAFFFMQDDGKLLLSRLVLVILFCLAASAAALHAGVWSESRLYYFGLPALTVFALFYYALPDVKARIWLFLVLVGEASYTLYLSHPFVLELVKIPVEILPLRIAGQFTLYLATGIVAATLFSLAFYSLLERQFTRRLTRRAPIVRGPCDKGAQSTRRTG